MYRIKDKVDLKELEKYGYLLGENTTNVAYNHYGKFFELDNNFLDIVEIDKKTREIELIKSLKKISPNRFVYDNDKLLINYIQDLIDAGLVEI